MPIHHIQGFQVFAAGFCHAVALVITHTINIMGAGIEEIEAVVISGMCSLNPPNPLKTLDLQRAKERSTFVAK